MNILTITLYIIFSFILGLILNKLETKKEDNYLDYIIINNICIFIISGIFKIYNISTTNIFLIPLFQIIGYIIYITSIKEVSINTYKNNFQKYLLTIITTYLLNILVINKLTNIFLTSKDLKLLIWILIIVYTYTLFKDNLKVPTTKRIHYYEDNEYIVMQYAKFKNKYYKDIKTTSKELLPLIYSIMIYENYQKPSIIRFLDKSKSKFKQKESKYGIMQIQSKEYIDDIASIKLATKKLEKIYKTTNNIPKVIESYYNNENKEIVSIYNEIIEFNKK